MTTSGCLTIESNLMAASNPGQEDAAHARLVAQKEKSRLRRDLPALAQLVAELAVALTLLAGVLALTAGLLLLLSGLLAAALLLAGLLARVLVLLARILVRVGHRNLLGWTQRSCRTPREEPTVNSANGFRPYAVPRPSLNGDGLPWLWRAEPGPKLASVQDFWLPLALLPLRVPAVKK
jgi:hypothetical protein